MSTVIFSRTWFRFSSKILQFNLEKLMGSDHFIDLNLLVILPNDRDEDSKQSPGAAGKATSRLIKVIVAIIELLFLLQ
jgi:hypothetical protein